MYTVLRSDGVYFVGQRGLRVSPLAYVDRRRGGRGRAFREREREREKDPHRNRLTTQLLLKLRRRRCSQQAHKAPSVSPSAAPRPSAQATPPGGVFITEYRTGGWRDRERERDAL